MKIRPLGSNQAMVYAQIGAYPVDLMHVVRKINRVSMNPSTIRKVLKSLSSIGRIKAQAEGWVRT